MMGKFSPYAGTCCILSSVELEIDENGGPERMSGIGESRSAPKVVSQALLESEERYRSLFENNPASLWEEDFSGVKSYVEGLKAQGVDDFRQYFAANPDELWRSSALVKILDVNQASLDLYGAKSKADLIERLEKVLCQESFEALEKQVLAIAEGETTFQTESVNRNLNGEPLKIILKWCVAPGHERTYSRVLVSILDITDRSRVEKDLRESEQRYRTLVDRSSFGIFVSRIDGSLIHANPRMVEMAGYDDVQDLTAAPAAGLYADSADRERLLKELREKGSVENFEVRALKKDGTPHWVSVSAVLQKDWTGKAREIHGIAEDITERKAAREKIKAALHEKEVLLREIHHRVKNNLAVVSSLLGLQSRHARDDYHRKMFLESQDRIRSMALAHEKLYQAENLSAINSKDYLTSLVHHLTSALGHVGFDVQIQTRIAEVDLDLETGVTLGLIVTELLSNCLKHAFPDDGGGTISLDLRENDSSTLELSVADNGVGLPQHVHLDKPSTLGLDLVRIFSRQLRGQLEVRRDGGTEIILRFSRRP
jgi:PAS domain S-box-containing protein